MEQTALMPSPSPAQSSAKPSKLLKVAWSDEEMESFNRAVGQFFAKSGEENKNSKVVYSPVSTFTQSVDEFGKIYPGTEKFVPRFNIEMFTWKSGKHPGGKDEKAIQLNKAPLGSFFIDCEKFMKEYKQE